MVQSFIMRLKTGDSVELDQIDLKDNSVERLKFKIIRQKLDVEILGINKSFGVNDSRRTKSQYKTILVDTKKGELGGESSLAKAILSNDIKIGTTFSNGKYRYRVLNFWIEPKSETWKDKEELSLEEKRAKFELMKDKPFFKIWHHEQLESQEYRCAWCRKSLDREESEVDHIIPLFSKGTNQYENLAISCHECNREKGTKNHYIKPAWIVKNKALSWVENRYKY